MTVQPRVSTGRIRRPSEPALHRVVMTVDAVGGVWRYAVDLSQSLQRRGLSVALIGFGPAPSRAQRAEAEAARLPLTWSDLPLDWMAGGIAALSDARCAIARAATAFAADLVHVNSLAYAGTELAPPVVAMAHSCLPTWWRTVRGAEVPADWQAHLHANAAGLRAAARVVAPSRSHAKLMRDEYGRELDILVVHNASAETHAYRRPREPLVFAAARWWDEAKNARVLDAAARSTKWPIVMAGPLQDPAGPRQTIAHAHALGPLDAAATREWMRRASIFAAPSIYEPFGLAILEAAHASTPLVLADIATFRELWDGAALFASPTEPTAFACAIETLRNDAALRRRLARRARERAAQFTLDRQAEATLAAYRAAMSGEMNTNLRSAV